MSSTPSKVRLLYFGGRARAELARIMLAAADIKYENVRMESEDFKKIKECK